MSSASPAFSFDSAPIPPAPFPAGRGRLKVILCKGLCPLHPRAESGRHRLFLWKAGSGGGLAWLVAGRPCRSGIRWGACLLCRLPTLPLACFLAPIPPTPFPAGRGRLKVILCKGRSPLHPGAEPGRHRLFLWKAGSGGGLLGWLPADLAVPESAGAACLLCRLPTLPLASILPPSPRPPSRREGGDSKFISPGASPPAPLQPGGKRHWICFWETVLLAFREKVFHRGQGFKCGRGCQYHWRLSLPDTYSAGSASVARVQAPGMQGAKPLA